MTIDLQATTTALNKFKIARPRPVQEAEALLDAVRNAEIAPPAVMPTDLTPDNVRDRIAEFALALIRRSTETTVRQTFAIQAGTRLERAWGSSLFEIFTSLKPQHAASVKKLTSALDKIPGGAAGLTPAQAVEGGYSDAYQRVLEAEEDLDALAAAHDEIVHYLAPSNARSELGRTGPSWNVRCAGGVREKRRVRRGGEYIELDVPQLSFRDREILQGKIVEHWAAETIESQTLELAWLTPAELLADILARSGRHQSTSAVLNELQELERDGYPVK